MKISKAVLLAIVALLVWFAITWFIPAGFLPSPISYYLRAALWILGLVAFVGYLLLRGQTSAGEGVEGSGIGDTFGEAAKRLHGAGIKQIGTLPAIFVLGDPGTAKTTIVAHSGLEPELLAGQVYEDNLIAPTRGLNLWYARNTLFVDPAGAILSDAGARRSLFRKFLPVRMNAAAKTPPTRAVVLAFDCEAFLQPGAAEALAVKAREFQKVLGELSQDLGSSLPVYVLFTKADRIAYFQDFVKNLTNEETGDLFGAVLPVRPAQNQGVYSEEQTRRLNEAFQRLYRVLCDRRSDYLARENEQELLPNVYEFPREFHKLRTLLIPFLVDLCRPSQFGTAPFLRGFYFTGVRPVVVADIAPVQAPVVEQRPFDGGATRIFTPQLSRGLPTPQTREAGSRKIPQWVYLPHFFTAVVLADRPASTVAQRNVKVNAVRRAMLGVAAAFAIFMAIWWAISFSHNRALVAQAIEAARAIPSANLQAGQLASADALTRLTRVKDTLAVLDRYAANGEPMSYDAFLYTGSRIRKPLSRTYYALFRRLLLGPTQQDLTALCTNPQNAKAQGYRYVYDALKTYLITTDHHEKSTPEFLIPVLLEHWQKGQKASRKQQDLARENFEFYAAGLAKMNPYPSFATPDSTAVENARAYLKKFAQEERIYQAMLLAAGKGQAPIVFNTDFPGSSATVINRYRVDPAFTKDGYAAFFKELKDPDRYFAGEEWVLGKQAFAAYDKQKLTQDLTQRYQQEFQNTWRDYLKATAVVHYRSVSDAAAKLARISSPQSPLLEVLCVASENTSVADKEVAAAFQPVQFVTPQGCSTKLVGASNKAYMQNLIGLSSSLGAIGSPPDPNNMNAANTAATQAENAVRTLALNFANDRADAKSGILSKTSEILREPIDRVPPLLAGAVKYAAAGPINAAAAGTCAAIAPMLKEYPFNPRATTDATLQQVNAFLQPKTGKLWQLYNSGLNKYLVLRGNGTYVPAPGQQLKVRRAFLNFFNRSAAMSEAFYNAGAGQPSFAFTMQPLTSPDVQHVTLTIDGQTLSTKLDGGAKSQSFNWPGNVPGVLLAVSFGGPDMQIAQTSGPWALWHFLDTGDRLHSSGSELQIQWVYRTSAGVTTIAGHPAAVKFALDSKNARIFGPHYFSGLTCTSKALE